MCVYVCVCFTFSKQKQSPSGHLWNDTWFHLQFLEMWKLKLLIACNRWSEELLLKINLTTLLSVRNISEHPLFPNIIMVFNFNPLKMFVNGVPQIWNNLKNPSFPNPNQCHQSSSTSWCAESGRKSGPSTGVEATMAPPPCTCRLCWINTLLQITLFILRLHPNFPLAFCQRVSNSIPRALIPMTHHPSLAVIPLC